MSGSAETNATRFIHFSDAHLGHHQFSSEDRYCDMYKSLKSMVHDATDKDVDFVAFSGDFLHNDTIDERVLRDAEKIFNELNEDDIPVVATCGNHDMRLCRNGLTWFDDKHSNGDLVHLEADLHDPQAMFKEYNESNCGISCGYVDFDNIRVFGLQSSEEISGDWIQDIGRVAKSSRLCLW